MRFYTYRYEWKGNVVEEEEHLMVSPLLLQNYHYNLALICTSEIEVHCKCHSTSTLQ